MLQLVHLPKDYVSSILLVASVVCFTCARDILRAVRDCKYIAVGKVCIDNLRPIYVGEYELAN